MIFHLETLANLGRKARKTLPNQFDDPKASHDITIVDDEGKTEYINTMRQSFRNMEKAWAEAEEGVTIKITDE